MTEPQTMCQCGHVREAHEHYRRGSDCGVCGRDKCSSFRAAVTQPAADLPTKSGPEAHTA